MKLSAIIVTFFPDEKDLIRNLNSLLEDVDQIIIWDNTPPDQRSHTFNQTIKTLNKKILIEGTGENIGIGAALNGGIDIAHQFGATHLLTLDQDSYFNIGTLNIYKGKIIAHSNEHIGIFGINPKCYGRLLYEKSPFPREVSDSITSGSIFPMKIFKECGKFRSELFIDAVDYEYCYRLKKFFGLKTLVFPDVILNHQVGYVTKTKLGFKTDNYSSFRTYFIVRNQIAIWKEYPELFPSYYKKILIKNHIIFRILKVILAEKNKYRKIRAILLGLIHGLNGHTGFYNAK